MTKNNTFLRIAPVLFGFFIMGVVDLIGVSVTYTQKMFDWSESQSGFLPSMVFFWFLILSIPTAIVMDKIGRKKTVLISMIFTFIGMIIPMFLFNELICFVVFALLGIGNTILQVSLNPLLTNIVSGEKLSSGLTAGQFIKAISSFLGPIIAGLCSTWFDNWTMLFPIYAGVTLLSTIWLYLTYIPEAKTETKPSSFKEVLGLLKDNKILLLFLGILCIVGLDVGMNIVTPKLLIERVSLSTESAGYGSSWYFAARTIGAAVSAGLLAKISERIYFKINIALALIGIVCLFFVGSQALILSCVCLIAFTCSSVFSIIFSLAMQARMDKANEISGLMITGVAGGAIFPILMGFASDFTGNQTGSIFIIMLTVIYLLFCAFGLKKETYD